LRGSPRRGAVYCGVSATASAIMFAAWHTTDIEETAAVDARVSPPARGVDVFPGIVRCSGTVVL
jgi:hypothetical protein